MPFADRLHAPVIAVALAFASAAPAAPRPSLPAQHYSYADLVDLAQAAPVVAVVTILSADRLKPAETGPIPPDMARFYVTAQLVTLLHGAGGLPARIDFLADLPLDAGGRPPQLKKAQTLLFARAVEGRPGTLQLVGPRGQSADSAALEQRVRGVLTALAAPDQPPRVTGIANAFHVPGSLPGESESQIFLTTADSRPVSLTVLRRPNQAPSWAVALGEMTDEAAAPPARDSLLWYRLACALPGSLPESALADVDPADAAATRDDYGVVLAGLGPCGRTSGAGQPPAS